jgi:hypothetical protein
MVLPWKLHSLTFGFKSVKSVRSLKQEFFREIWRSAHLELEFRTGGIGKELNISIFPKYIVEKRIKFATKSKMPEFFGPMTRLTVLEFL